MKRHGFVAKDILICGIMTLFSLASTAKADWTYFAAFNPGIKVGYAFGSKPGLTAGVELSATAGSPYLYGVWAGTVMGVQYYFGPKFFAHYEEIEFGIPMVGTAFGVEGRLGKLLFHYRVFGGMVGYFSFKHVPRAEFTEISFVYKYPVFISTSTDHSGTEHWVTLHEFLN